jgi:Ca2+-transporting ATPase
LRGISGATAVERLRLFGPNRLVEKPPRSGMEMFLGQFASFPVALLAGAAGLSILTGGLADAALIAVVVLANAGIGYATESGTERVINSLKSLVTPTAMVVRDGLSADVDSVEIVPGDLLELRPGSIVAADARVVETDRLSIDESALTGESHPVEKNPVALVGPLSLSERRNMAFMGTLVLGGRGRGVVVGTGMHTELGRIQALVGETATPATPMETELRRVGDQLVLIATGICGLVFLVGLFRGQGLLPMISSAISLTVAAVPEGLPTVATTTLAVGVNAMQRRRALVRRLDAVDTIGAVSTFCFDKTGTITLNRMTVGSMLVGVERFERGPSGFHAAAGGKSRAGLEGLRRLLAAAVLCSEAQIEAGPGGPVFRGSPTETAILSAAAECGVDIAAVRAAHPVLEISLRAENRNTVATLHRAPGGSALVAVKGSPPEVLDRCATVLVQGKTVSLDDETRARIEQENDRMAGEALRVLGVASGRHDPASDANGATLTWLGLVGMADPVRPGVASVIERFHRAGIRTVMITGDQSPTAYAIGRELGLAGDRSLEILDSTRLDSIDPELLRALAAKVDVFARVSPAHKLQIVQALQASGEVVAMTGDGVNDGPALKAADVGIAMGAAGTDAAREIADIVLEDDELATMVDAVGQGRAITGNIRKTLRFLLATNLSEIIVMFAALSAGLGPPLSPMQLLWINLISDIFPGLALAQDPPEGDLMERPPAAPPAPLLSGGDYRRILGESSILAAASLGAFGYGVARYGPGARAGTLAFLSLSAAQLLHSLTCRSKTHRALPGGGLAPNPHLRVALAGSFGLLGLAALLPGLRRIVGIAPIGLADAVVVAGSSLWPWLVLEGAKRPKGDRP